MKSVNSESVSVKKDLELLLSPPNQINYFQEMFPLTVYII